MGHTSACAGVEFAFEEGFVASELLGFLVMRLHFDVCGQGEIFLQRIHCIIENGFVDAVVNGVEEAHISTCGADLLCQLFPFF
jgi:hypothetical protein